MGLAACYGQFSLYFWLDLTLPYRMSSGASQIPTLTKQSRRITYMCIILVNGANIYSVSSNDMLQLWDAVLRKRSMTSEFIFILIICSLSDLGYFIAHRFAAFTRWCNLIHFDRVTNITYSDSNKLRDISKVWHADMTLVDRWWAT